MIKTLPGSPAEAVLRNEDEILEINGKSMASDLLQGLEPSDCELTILRKGSKKSVVLKRDDKTYFPNYKVEINDFGETSTARMNWLSNGF